ncbi:MAG: AMP-binding protein [Gammaproteobacteria bacterium]|nr:AMP-binding protein [Gammaproteobacteria bacterium]MDH5799439.1 AMP-binding protein [Gammaproteobacteria bacterium]
MDTKRQPASDEPIWVKSYPHGIPAEVDIHAYQSIVAVLEQSSQRFSESPAFSNMGRSISYSELGRLTQDFAAYLQSLGLKRGDKVAIMMPNVLQYPIAIFGCLRAGVTVTNINPLYTPRELKHQLNDSGAKCIIILENFCHVLAQVIPDTAVQTVITTRLGDLLGFPKSAIVNFVVKHIKKMVPAFQLSGSISFSRALDEGASRNLQAVDLSAEDIAFIQYTAGTTGESKGVLLTHGNIVANLQQISAWLGPHVEEGKELIVTPLPLYHIFSLTANCLYFMKIGARIHLITNPRDFKGFVKELSGLPFTAITGVNTLFNALLNTPGFAQLDFSKLKITLGGGMAVQRAVAERWKEVTGDVLVEAYGLTETSPAVCINPIDMAQYNGKIGLPIPSTECSIQDDQGNMLAPGEPGELCVRGPQVMQGYLGRPEQTAKVLKDDGWFHTGDMSTMDENGYVQILERKDDMILVSGFNVYPNEVESVIVEHPGVLEVAVIGVPDEKSGEVVKAFVVKKDPALTENQIREHCKQGLTAYKVPKQVEFIDSLPKSNVGKILRRQLR